LIPFIESQLQEACQRGLVAAFVGHIVAEKRKKKDRGVENSAVLFLSKKVNELNVISQQFDQGLFLESAMPF
jgi:hypothetical protein